MTEMTPVETENPFGSYGKTISHVIIGLKTVKGTKQLKLDPSIYESLQKEKVQTGDVIYIEANSGSVKVYIPYLEKNNYYFDTNLEQNQISLKETRSMRYVCNRV